MNLRAKKTAKLALGALLLPGLFAFTAPAAEARSTQNPCAALYRLFRPEPTPTPAAEASESTWRQTFRELGSPRKAAPPPAPAALSRGERVAAAEAKLPWSEEARITQAEQLLELRAQVTRQGKFRDPDLDEWVEVLELRNAKKKLLDPDPDGPDFLRQAKNYRNLSEDERLEWVKYFGRSEHEQAYPALKILYRSEPSPKVREVFTVLGLDRGFEFDSAVRARDLAQKLARAPRIDEHVAANLRSLSERDFELLLLSREPAVRRHARAGLPGRSRAFLQRLERSLPDPETRAAATAELRRRLPAPPAAELTHDDPLVREAAFSKLRPHENPEHLAAFTQALLDPVAEVKLAALETLGRGPSGQTPELRRLLRALGQNDESIRVRRRAHDLLEPYSRRAYAIAPSRTFLLDAMRRKFPTHIKLPPERARDMELMLAASHVYDAPELGAARDAKDLVRQHRRFLGSIPADYEVSFLLTDPATGFKAAIYKPTSAARAGQPAVVAIGGTQTGKDILADLNWGVAQARSNAYARLLEQVQNELKKSSRPVAITGHSLGGGLAQMLGYDLNRALKTSGRAGDAERFRVVSWNGFGAKEALQKLKRWRAEEAKDLPVTSYFHPDDIVSKLGTHLGQTIAIRARAGDPRGLSKLKESHVIKAVQDLFSMEQALAEAEPALPSKSSKMLRALEAFAKATGGLTDRFLSPAPNAARSARELRILAEARHEWAKAEGYRELNESYDWLKEEMDAALARPGGQGFGLTIERLEKENEKLKQIRRSPNE